MIGLVLAASGTGSRFGSETPKQFALLRGNPLYLHALECFATFFDQAVIVLPSTWKEEVAQHIQSLSYRDKLTLVVGGEKRQDSVRQGLYHLSQAMEIVLVHDAARPFAPPDLISRVIGVTRKHGACVPVLSVTDTVKEVSEERVVRTVAREGLVLAQTPQGFDVSLLKRAFAQAEKDGFYGTDEAALVERLNEPIHVVSGDKANIKITEKEDL